MSVFCRCTLCELISAIVMICIGVAATTMYIIMQEKYNDVDKISSKLQETTCHLVTLQKMKIKLAVRHN